MSLARGIVNDIVGQFLNTYVTSTSVQELLERQQIWEENQMVGTFTVENTNNTIGAATEGISV